MRNKWEKVKAKVKLVLMVDDDDDQAPSEQDIEDALKILVSRKPELLEDSEGYNRTFRELRNELVPKIDEGITLTDQNSAWKPWLSDMQSSDTWETPRSDSYYQYLVMDKNSSYSTLDYTANEIVKLLADPRRDQPAVSRKGLILGDVQSGSGESVGTKGCGSFSKVRPGRMQRTRCTVEPPTLSAAIPVGAHVMTFKPDV